MTTRCGTQRLLAPCALALALLLCQPALCWLPSGTSRSSPAPLRGTKSRPARTRSCSSGVRTTCRRGVAVAVSNDSLGLGEEGEFRLKGEGHWKGVMQRFSFVDESGAFKVPEPYSTDGPPLPYTLEMHRCGLDMYRVATTWGANLDAVVEEHALGRGEKAVSSVSSSDFDQDEDGSYRMLDIARRSYASVVAHCCFQKYAPAVSGAPSLFSHMHTPTASVQHTMLDVARRSYASVVEHCISVTTKERVRLLVGYGLAGELRAVHIMEEFRDAEKLSPSVVIAMREDMMQGVGAADEMGVDEERVVRTSMSLLALAGGVWQGRGRVRLHGTGRGELLATLSTGCRVDIAYEWGGGTTMRKRMAVAVDAAGGAAKSRIKTRDPDVERMVSWGTVDEVNTDLLHLDAGAVMMMLPGGCYAVFPRTLGGVPKELAAGETDGGVGGEGEAGKGTVVGEGAPFQTEFGLFFDSAPTAGATGVTEGERHLVRNQRLHQAGALSSCIHSHHTWTAAEEEP